MSARAPACLGALGYPGWMVRFPCPCCDGWKVIESDREDVFVDPEGSCRCALSADQHRHLLSWGRLLLMRRYRRVLARWGGRPIGMAHKRAKIVYTAR